MTLLFKLLSLLPLTWLQALGALVGRWVYLFSARYAQRLKTNAQFAGYQEPQLLRAAAEHAGRAVAELPHLWFRQTKRAVEQVHTQDWALVEQAWARGKGIIFLTPHLGCFEVTAQYYALHAPITALYRPARKAWLRKVVDETRGRHNLLTAPADLKGVRSLLKALKSGQAIGLLPDQVPGEGEGVWAPFFSCPAYTMTLPGKLARSTGASIILAYAVRLAGGRYQLHLHSFDEPLTDDPIQQATQINAAMQRLISECPEQYLWSYNRYKVPQGVSAPTTTHNEQADS